MYGGSRNTTWFTTSQEQSLSQLFNLRTCYVQTLMYTLPQPICQSYHSSILTSLWLLISRSDLWFLVISSLSRFRGCSLLCDFNSLIGPRKNSLIFSLFGCISCCKTGVMISKHLICWSWNQKSATSHFHSTLCLWATTTLIPVVIFYSFSLPYCSLFYKYTMVYLFSYWWTCMLFTNNVTMSILITPLNVHV